uniref:Glyco_18 domain-containing protein n=1 Tax=Caenorhabditis tropicalis TaxID=1561998 RepID=A0A1I7UCG6_9PELO
MDAVRKRCKLLGFIFTLLMMAGIIALACTYILFYFDGNSSIQNDFQTTSSPHLLVSPIPNPNIPATSCGKRIMSYQRGWEVDVEERQLKKLTHMIFCFVSMNSNGDVSLSSNQMRASLSDMKTKARAVKNDVKMMVAIGGAGGGSMHFSKVLANERTRKYVLRAEKSTFLSSRNFIDSISSFLVIHQLDGVDIFWIWPEGKDVENIVIFMKELRIKLTNQAEAENRKEAYVISMVIPRRPSLLEALNKLDEVLEYADFLNALTYDYFGPAWYPDTGPVAPLYSGTKGNEKLEFVGRYWKNVKGPIDESDEMWRMAEYVNGSIEGQSFSWKTLESGAFDKTSAVWHDASKSSYIWIPEEKTFVTFEGERSLMEKMHYAKNKNLGGILIWTVGSDDDEDTLLNLVSKYNFCKNDDRDSVNYEC